MQQVVFVAVNVGAQDTIRVMAGQAVDQSIPFLMVKDYDLQVAKALGVSRVPECVVLDKSLTIRYRGRIDDQFRLGGTKPNASRKDLKIAIDEILAGKEVSVAETAVDGCRSTEPSLEENGSELTYHKDIAKIILQHCSPCHHAGTAAPFSLMTYEDVSSHAMLIQTMANSRMMLRCQKEIRTSFWLGWLLIKWQGMRLTPLPFPSMPNRSGVLENLIW